MFFNVRTSTFSRWSSLALQQTQVAQKSLLAVVQSDGGHRSREEEVGASEIIRKEGNLGDVGRQTVEASQASNKPKPSDATGKVGKQQRSKGSMYLLFEA